MSAAEKLPPSPLLAAEDALIEALFKLMPEHVVRQAQIYACLPPSKEYAIPTREIMLMFGISKRMAERDLQLLHQRFKIGRLYVDHQCFWWRTP
jgi:hypothetical protein